MKKVLVIGSRDHGLKNNSTMIAEKLNRADSVAVDHIYWEDILLSVQASGVSITHRDQELLHFAPDAVLCFGWYKSGKKAIYRELAFSVALYFKTHHIEVWNSEILHQRSTGKLSCMVQLSLAGVDVPPTIFTLDKSLLREKTNLPAIIKASAASRGENNHLIKTDDELYAVLSGDGINTFIVQPFIPNDCDFRVICMGGEPKLILKRSRSQSSKTHLNNVSQGASAEWVDIDGADEQLLTISKKICKIMKRELSGIDFIKDPSSDSGYACLEVNAIPQLTSGYGVETKLDKLIEAVENI